MGNQPLSGDLPDHLRGRGTYPSPWAGGYVCFVVAVDNLANSEVPDFNIVAPYDLRVMEVSSKAQAITSDPTIRVTNGGATVVEVSDLLATATIHTLVDATRNVAKGDRLQVRFSADSGDAATAAVVTVTCAVRGHVNTDVEND